MCLLGGPKPVNLGRVRDSPQWVDGVAVLTYVDGDLCPDQIRKKSTTIRLTCSENQVVSDVASSALALPLLPREPGGAGHSRARRRLGGRLGRRLPGPGGPPSGPETPGPAAVALGPAGSLAWDSGLQKLQRNWPLSPWRLLGKSRPSDGPGSRAAPFPPVRPAG